MTKVLFLVPYPPGEAPSQRFRFEQYLDLLADSNIEYEVRSFLSLSNWRIFYQNGRPAGKVSALISGLFQRIKTLATSSRYDFIFIHREAAPVGPPIIEWFLAIVLRKKIIYDFDDAIWMTDNVHEGMLQRILKWRSKVASICRWAYKVSCGNEFLSAYAAQFNPSIVFLPTTLVTDSGHTPAAKASSDESITIGWTGSHSTLKYLNPLEPVLKNLTSNFSNLTVRVIADRKPDFSLANLEFVPWNKTTEVEDLRQIDIGVMPLPDDDWSKGKCGFKALQYMALEIPAVVSAVGANSQIVRNGIDGFVVNSEAEWLDALSKLIVDPELRKVMGRNGRQRVLEHYSVASNSARFLSLFS